MKTSDVINKVPSGMPTEKIEGDLDIFYLISARKFPLSKAECIHLKIEKAWFTSKDKGTLVLQDDQYYHLTEKQFLMETEENYRAVVEFFHSEFKQFPFTPSWLTRKDNPEYSIFEGDGRYFILFDPAHQAHIYQGFFIPIISSPYLVI